MLFRENLPVGVIQASTPALADVSTGEEQAFFKRLIASSGLVTGTNVLAVEIHQFRTNSVDLSFDLELVGMTDRPEALRPRLKIKHAAADVALSWPAAHNGSLLYTARTLHTAEAWAQSTAPVLLSNGWNNVYISPSHDGGFYQLRKPGFCTPSP